MPVRAVGVAPIRMHQRHSGTSVGTCRASKSRTCRLRSTRRFVAGRRPPVSRCRSTCYQRLAEDARTPTLQEVLDRAGGSGRRPCAAASSREVGSRLTETGNDRRRRRASSSRRSPMTATTAIAPDVAFETNDSVAPAAAGSRGRLGVAAHVRRSGASISAGSGSALRRPAPTARRSCLAPRVDPSLLGAARTAFTVYDAAYVALAEVTGGQPAHGR